MVTMPILCKTCHEPFIGASKGRLGPRVYCSHRCRSKDPEFQAKISVNKTGAKAPKLPIDGTVERLYVEGLGCPDIAKRFNCGAESVRLFLKRRGIARRSKTVSTPAKQARAIVMPTDEIARLYSMGATQAELAQKYGVSKPAIAARLRAAGVTMRRSFWGADMPYRCEDGHLVRSRYEQIVDDWLWQHRVLHAYEPALPFSATQRGDFLAGDTYVEVWGVIDRPDYADRKRRKLAEYEASGLSVISLYPRHMLEELDRHLAPLLTI